MNQADLHRIIKDQQARLDHRAKRLQEMKHSIKLAHDLQRECDQLRYVVNSLSRRHYKNLPLPPEHLRLNVGTRTTEGNFWSQGMRSSTRVIEIFGETPAGPILDWGCGSGRTLRWLLAYPGWEKHYYGVDVDEEAVSWLLSQGSFNVNVCNDLPPLPYPDRMFSGLFAFSVLTHIHPEQHKTWYAELHRVLNNDGVAYLTTLGPSALNEQMNEAASEFSKKDFIFLERKGHYKSAAIVGEKFVKKQLEGLFTVEQYEERGYNNMDAYLVRRVN